MANIALKHNNERGKDGEGNRFPDPEYKGWQWGSRGEIMSSEKDREKEREKQTNEHAQMARTSADLKRIWKMSRKNHIKAMLYATQSQSVVQHIGIHHFVSEKPFFFSISPETRETKLHHLIFKNISIALMCHWSLIKNHQTGIYNWSRLVYVWICSQMIWILWLSIDLFQFCGLSAVKISANLCAIHQV